MSNFEISVIIPVFNDHIQLLNVLNSLSKQSFLPKEIIIIDSSDSDELIINLNEFENNKITLIYKKVNKAYAGKNTNYGVSFSTTKYIAFLDTKTIPDKNWLLNYKNEFKEKKIDVVFGVTRFNSRSKLEELIRAASYGNIGHETVPGTILCKNNFSDNNYFIENLRAGYDIEWKNRIKKKFKFFTPKYSSVVYSLLPKNLIELYKRYVIYSFHSAKVDIQTYTKSAYLSLFVIFSAIIIPKWNFISCGTSQDCLGNWELNPLYIPYITRIYLIALIFILFSNLLINNFFYKKFAPTFYLNTLKIVVFIFISIGVYRWNNVIAGWVEEAVWYVPHITKIYILLIFILSIVYRGLLLPITRKISKKFLFPYNFILVGFLGLSLDLIKAPGYIIGSILGFVKFSNLKYYKKKINN